jgi:hypothetical protein
MKTLGIVGGLGPESTIEYYRFLLAAYRERRPDGSSAAIIINSLDVQRGIALLNANQLAEFEFPAVPGRHQTSTLETRNAAPPTLDETAAAQMLTDKVRRLLFLHGFFRLRNLEIQVEALPETVHLPYWVGFYGSGQDATLRVIDAVRRRPEGAKMRHALRHWLAG